MDFNNSVIVLCSGDADSMLTLCRIVSNDYTVHPLVCDNGCISDIQHAEAYIEMARNRFKDGTVKSTIIHHSGFHFKSLYHKVNGQTLGALSKILPSVSPCHITCLLCHSVMIASAVGVAKALGVTRIADGIRKQEGFVMSTEAISDKYKEFTVQHKVQLDYPVYDVTDSHNALSLYGIQPIGTEPQCCLGCPDTELNDAVIEQLLNFYEHIVKDSMSCIVKEVQFAHKNIRR